jgi:hypothetical protein
VGAMLPHGRQEAPTHGVSGPMRPGEGSRPAGPPEDSMSLAARHWESAAVILYLCQRVVERD